MTLQRTAWSPGGEFLFAVECNHPDDVRRFAGSVSLIDRGARRAEVSVGAQPAVRGRGVIGTAVDLLLDYGFGALDLETVIWWANRGNLVAQDRLGAGFSFGGTVPHWMDHRGEYPDGWVASLHRGDPREPLGPWVRDPRAGDRPTQASSAGREGRDAYGRGLRRRVHTALAGVPALPVHVGRCRRLSRA